MCPTPAAPEDLLVTVYSVYAAVSLLLTLALARTLFKNGAVFLESVFVDDPRMAAAVNRLLVVGFYLVNFGYACLLLKAPATASLIEGIEILAGKLGLLLLSLAAMHFFNLLVFWRIRRRGQSSTMIPPIAPQLHVGA